MAPALRPGRYARGSGPARDRNPPTPPRSNACRSAVQYPFAPQFSREVTMFVPLTPIRCLHRAVDLFGGRTGIVSGAQQFTYAQFGERSERLATGLAAAGIRPGDRVAYLSFNNHQLFEGYYGVVQARGIVMPLNVRPSPVELVNILNHSGARMLIFENDLLPLIEKLRPECPGIQRFVSIDEKTPLADLTYEELIDQGHPERADVFQFDENAVAELFYTSGSTGTPK